MPARIAFVAPFGLGQKTTVWARTLPLARYLASQGQAVTLVIPPWDTPADAGKRMTDGGVEVVQVALGGGLPAVISRMLAVVNGWQPDLVHIVKPRAHAGIIQWLLWQRRKVKGSPAARRHTPAILLDVDDWEQAWAPINRYRWPVARFLAWQEEWGIRHADGITAASRWLVERVRQYTPQTPVLYLPNGIRNAGYGMRDTGIRDQAGQAVTRILFFTRFVEVEPAWLAQCWRAIAAALPTAHLVLAGSPVQPGLDAPIRQALAGEAAERVQWLGFVPSAEHAALYASVACAIFPAQAVPLHQAKCSVRLATTLLHGVPVVASAVGEQATYGAEGAASLVSPQATPSEFAAAVVDLIRQPAAQAAMVRQARQRLAAAYQWSDLGAQLNKFYANWL
jgi:glycosyltransferase involved in cell wall biosynthesis